jgi:transposase
MSKMIWVGLDVHKNSTTAAILEDDARDGEVLRLSADLNELRKLFRRLGARATVKACYEASAVGFVVHRVLSRDGFSCQVIAPSLIPTRPGDRRKTDRRDALALARLYRSGHLTPVQVPDEEQEAVRALVRTRFAILLQAKKCKQRIHSQLLRQGLVFRDGKSYWTKTHRVWLAQVRRQAQGAVATVLQTELELLEYLETQIRSLDAEIERHAQRPPYQSVVEALECLRGVKTLTAMTLATEIGDIQRFRSPRALMAWVGLVPSENSSGDRERRGPITKTGNAHLRRVLVEAGHNHRVKAGSNLILERRRQGQAPQIVGIAVKAQHRLSKRYWHLALKKHHNVAVVAVARELCGFIWAIMRAATIEPEIADALSKDRVAVEIGR